MSLWERVKYSMVEPDDDSGSVKEAPPVRPVEEVQEDLHRSNDKERTIGLVVAPVAAIVAIAISTASINYARTHNQNVHVYEELTYVLLGLAALILVASLLRKRLFQGITVALFGLAVFQLHYTYVGFAAPFILVGAWYMVRVYRLQQELRRSEADADGPRRTSVSAARGSRPRPSKRYTPPR
jgi:Ca2+/Na+ antiporter